METLITTLAGLGGGLALSLLFWYWQTKWIVPRVAFSTAISRIRRPDGAFVYRVKISNTGRRRVIDANFYCKIVYVSAPTLSAAGLKNVIVNLLVPLAPSHVFSIGSGNRWLVQLKTDSNALRTADSRYTDEVISVIEQSDDGPLEKLMSLGERAVARIHVLCYDEWSGARKYFVSPSYSVDQIIPGSFAGLKVEPSSLPFARDGIEADRTSNAADETPQSRDPSPSSVDQS